MQRLANSVRVRNGTEGPAFRLPASRQRVSCTRPQAVASLPRIQAPASPATGLTAPSLPTVGQPASPSPPAPSSSPAQQMVRWAGACPHSAGVAVLSTVGTMNRSLKAHNQDAYIVERVQPAPNAPAATVLGVLDGHGSHGHAASRHVAAQLAAAVHECAREAAAAAAAAAPAPDESLLWWDAEFYFVNLGSASALDSEWCPEGEEGCLVMDFSHNLAQETLERAFTRAAESMAAAHSEECDLSRSGSTAVMCMVLPDSVVAVWAGDSRAVVGTAQPGGGYTPTQLTRDHRPSDSSELSRIREAGGRVVRATDRSGNPVGPFRVVPGSIAPGGKSPGLSVTRAFGDLDLSSVGVAPIPDVAVFPRSSCSSPSPAPASEAPAPGSAAPAAAAAAAAARPGEVLVVATDGVWDVLSNAEAVEIAGAGRSPEEAAAQLVEAAKQRWAVRSGGAHCDDVTVAVAWL